MTFLELQRQIEQTRKARRGVGNRQDYFEDEPEVEAFYLAAYKRALSVANEVIRHYEAVGRVDAKDRPKVIWKG